MNWTNHYSVCIKYSFIVSVCFVLGIFKLNLAIPITLKYMTYFILYDLFWNHGTFTKKYSGYFNFLHAIITVFELTITIFTVADYFSFAFKYVTNNSHNRELFLTRKRNCLWYKVLYWQTSKNVDIYDDYSTWKKDS